MRQHHGVGSHLRNALLSHLGAGRQAAHAGNADHRIELLAAGEIKNVAAHEAAEPGDGEGQDPQNQEDQNVGVEDGVGLAEHAEEQAEEEGRPIEQGPGEEVRVVPEAALAYHDPDEERQEERRRDRKQQAEQRGSGDAEDDLLPRGNLADRLHRHLHAPNMPGDQELDHVGIAAVGEAQVEVGHHRDRHEKVLGQQQRGEKDHRPVGAADGGDGGRIVDRQAGGPGQRKGGDGAELGAERDEHALERPRHHVADVEQRADAHEHQAGDQAVREGEGVDRLQPVDLQHRHQRRRLHDQGIDEEVALAAVLEEQHAGIDRGHAEPHGDHQQALQHALAAQVDQQHAQRDQEEAHGDDLGLGGR